jgi:hypothetical protein
VQSKYIRHVKKRDDSMFEPGSIHRTSPPTQGAPQIEMGSISMGKEREFLWDETFPLVFVVVFSHAEMKVKVRESGVSPLGPGSADGVIFVKNLKQGRGQHTVAIMSKGKEVRYDCLSLGSSRR